MKISKFLFGIFWVAWMSVCSFAQETLKTVPRFEKSDCAVPLPAGEKAECGYLVVKESRSAKNEKNIRLPVIILKAENADSKKEPVLRTFGGPGASSLRLVRSRRFSPWLKNRDLIIFEQRGTKYAQPALECPEVDEANISSAKKQLDRKSARTAEIDAAKTCFDRLTAQGIDLSAYNSSESAADIEDLRRVLKFERLNLWGLSYSSRLMLNVMRDYPKGIRSVVLESTLPTEINYDEVGVDGMVYALERLFKNCKTDTECADAYPNLENEFYETVARLNKEPVAASAKVEKTGETAEIKLNGDDFATWIVDYFLSNSAEAIRDAPYVIRATFMGKYEPFKAYASEKISPSNYSLGMRYSVWCSEEIPFENREKIAAQSVVYPRLKGYEVMALPEICSVWKVRGAKSIENKPVKSEIPTFVIGAEYDAYTPPEWGRSTASKYLKNGFFVETPWAGHGPSFSTQCLGNLIAEFFENPVKAPNSAECLEKVRRQYKFTLKK